MKLQNILLVVLAASALQACASNKAPLQASKTVAPTHDATFNQTLVFDGRTFQVLGNYHSALGESCAIATESVRSAKLVRFCYSRQDGQVRRLSGLLQE
ncbi:hypothetical protein ACFO4O_07940 [Glaciecola siphonariae]|uniref:Lipoprotein n=1 Tax=Glaciecola siphonariae TaxID=521012 RepID=A0ABV9LW68_9ALTE